METGLGIVPATGGTSMAVGREAGMSKHAASTDGGRNTREGRTPRLVARNAPDHPSDIAVGRAGRHRGEVARHRPLFARPKNTPDSQRHCRRGWMASASTPLSLNLSMSVPRCITGFGNRALAHVPEKWEPVFRQGHLPLQKNLAPLLKNLEHVPIPTERDGR